MFLEESRVTGGIQVKCAAVRYFQLYQLTCPDSEHPRGCSDLVLTFVLNDWILSANARCVRP